MATHCIPRDPLTGFVVGARRILLSACTVVLVSCGGGQGEPAAPVDSVGPTPAPMPAPGSTPAQLVVGTAQSIDVGASGNPLTVRVARSANGDGFAVWLAEEGTVEDGTLRLKLWVNRYSAATAAWGSPFEFETSCPGGAGNFDLTVDAIGNAVVAWQELTLASTPCGGVKSARFDAGAGAWATPVVLNADVGQVNQLSVAGDANGAVLVTYVVFVNGSFGIHGRFFDPVSGTWQPEAAIAQISGGSFSDDSRPVALLDGSGNALAAWQDSRVRESNYFSRSTGDWVLQLPANEGVVPGSFSIGSAGGHQLAASTGGDVLLAFSAVANSEANPPEPVFEIRIARFTSSTRTWSAAQPLVRGTTGNVVRFQSIGSDAGGNALVLWTESGGTRSKLKAMRLDLAGASCSAAQTIDSAVGGGAEFAKLAVDPKGHAIAAWAQFEGGRPFVGRENIAMNRFDGATGTWTSAVFAEMEPGDARGGPDASANGGQALLGWIQAEGGANRRVKALLQPLTNTPGQ
jgi:hypothetical protein